MTNEQQSEPKPPTETFGEVLYAYTRAGAIADGVLIAIPEPDAEAFGITLPLAVNASVWRAANAIELDARLQLIRQTRDAVLAAPLDSDRAYFNLRLPSGKTVSVVIHCGPGDNGEPVLTLCEPSDL